MTVLAEYAGLPIAFTVDRVLDVTNRNDGSGRFDLSERRLDVPYTKDYDAIAGEGPLQWGRRFDLSNWPSSRRGWRTVSLAARSSPSTHRG